MKSSDRGVLNRIEEVFYRIGLFIYLFRKEKVHQYFLILVLLMVLSAGAFFIIEADYINKATAGVNDDGLPSRILAILYWSIMTISTTGYGDIIPQTNAGRGLVVILLFFSIVAVSLFTANLASALTNKKLLESRGIMEIAKLKDHFVICGWKDRMGKFLDEVVNNNPGIKLKKITIIANIEADDIELFRQNYPVFKDIIIIRGDHYNETLLRKSNIAFAAKVLILSDDSNPDSSVGVDSLTVLTAMTIRSISINVSITAELTDIKFEKYLRAASVDEIIYSNEYSSALLANSLQQIGLTKVVNDLLIKHQTAFLVTEQIPQDLHGKKFYELKEHYQEKEGSLVIGLLENVGNLMERKKEAIRTAQKTADVNLLIGKLKMAKNIENNQSNILPDNDYIIPNNSLVILIKKQKKLIETDITEE